MADNGTMAVYPLRSSSRLETAQRMANLAEVWERSRVTKAMWAEELGVSPRTLGRWLNDWTMDGESWTKAATNVMDGRQVAITRELFGGVSLDYLLHSGVPQPGQVPILYPTNAEPDRYTPDRVRMAYGGLSKENQRKVTAYIHDLMVRERLERDLLSLQCDYKDVLGESARLLLALRDGRDLDESRLDGYLGMCESAFERSEEERHIGEVAEGDQQMMEDYYIGKFWHHHNAAAYRGRKATPRE